MHELAIAGNVVEIAVRHARGRRVTKVNLRVGRLRQVVPSALGFSFDLVAQGTLVEGAKLVIEDVPATGRCRACGASTRLDAFPLVCGDCGRSILEITQGEELYVDSLELEETTATTPYPQSPTEGRPDAPYRR